MMSGISCLICFERFCLWKGETRRPAGAPVICREEERAPMAKSSLFLVYDILKNEPTWFLCLFFLPLCILLSRVSLHSKILKTLIYGLQFDEGVDFELVYYACMSSEHYKTSNYSDATRC